MAFVNLTPDKGPDGVVIPLGMGVRHFYFSFVASANTANAFLSRNIYRNEEFLSALYDYNGILIMNPSYITNVKYPTSFVNYKIGLSLSGGISYTNNTLIPNFVINNLVIGKTYIFESMTNYNDYGNDFGIKIVSGGLSVPLVYMKTTLTPNPPEPPIEPTTTTTTTTLPPSPDEIPPTGLQLGNSTTGVLLTWIAVTGATSYNIYRCGFFLASSVLPTYLDSNLVSGTKYSYSVSSVYSTSESIKSPTKTIVTNFIFTNLSPNTNSDMAFCYFLFTPINASLEAYLCYTNSTNTTAVIGLYDSTNPSANLMNSLNVTNLDANVVFGPVLTNYTGIKPVSSSVYVNNGTIPNFIFRNLTGDLTNNNAVLKTYILEVVCLKPQLNTSTHDLGIYLKNPGDGNYTQLLFNSCKATRGVPNIYVMKFNFASTDPTNYSKYIYPNMYIFQNVKNVVENTICCSPGARQAVRNYDMLVNFSVAPFSDSTIIGTSSINSWAIDNTRSPDFIYAQDIQFSSSHFDDGYFKQKCKFNGSNTVNGRTNLKLFNTLLHEIHHGLGVLYADSYNSTHNNIGWNQYVFQASGITDQWYNGPSALTAYRTYLNNNTFSGVPIEGDYGNGTALTHWEYGDKPDGSVQMRTLNGVVSPAPKLELMTGFIGAEQYLTRLTWGALKDYGYKMNLNSPYVVHYPFGLTVDALNVRNVQCVKECNHCSKHVIREI
jgi:hypothetical protein